jgi:3-oxoacyl-[acyl-carrier protein] reductase
MNNRLEDRRALVTGSSRGIGRQIAIGLAQEGCNVILHGRSKENCEETVRLLEPFGVEVDVVEGDLSKEEDVRSIIATVLERYGHIDILYNNAAISTSSKSIYEFTPDDFRRMFDVNLYSMVLLCSAFAPLMRERGYGRIVNVSSGIKDQPNLVTYSVSKAAVDKYTMDLSWELKGTGVLVNYIDPGWIRTDLGGSGAPNAVETVLPGMIVPVLLPDDGPTGQLFRAQDYQNSVVV